MLGFFRKYQQYFFILITIVIVISFSFFGTYNALPNEDTRELPAFRAIDGTLISRSDLNEMVIFLSTDTADKMLFGGAWGPNFLNDGVIKKDLLQTGVAEILATQYASEVAPDLEKRLIAEKRFNLYTHPEANFVSTEAAWSYFAPTMLSQYQVLSKADSPLTPEAFSARVNLFLGEKSFPQHTLRQVLSYQEKQYSWLNPDPNLERNDLSLFGYHTTEDWFGPRFIRIAAEFIINSAKVAEQRGYRVSKAEALADLTQNANQSYKQNLDNPQLGVTSSTEYFREQLRRMGLDQSRAVKIWQNVLLSRRLFQDAGHSVFTSPELFSEFTNYAKESVHGDLYQLPKELKLADYQALQKFELYLDAIASRTPEEKNALTMPNKTYSTAEIAKAHPELVQKRYLLEIAQIDKNALLPKAGIKETWNWEVEDANWALLKKEFPDLGVKPGDSRTDRFAALDSLNEKTRSKVDEFARTKILESHPEWIRAALNEESPTRVAIGLPLKGSAGAPFVGIKDASTLIGLLDEASEAEGTEKHLKAVEQLSQFTADQQHYYAIKVVERLPEPEVLTFIEANRLGVLDKMLTSTLQNHYQKIRDSQPEKFQKEDKSWKDLADVKEKVADSYFANALKAIQAQSDDKASLTGNLAAPRRMLAHVKLVKGHLTSNPASAVNEIKVKEADPKSSTDLVAAVPLTDQWKLEKQTFSIDRSTKHDQINSAEALNLPINNWSEIVQSPNGAIAFYQKLEVKNDSTTALLQEKNLQAQRLLSGEIQRLLANQLISEFKAKNAISLEFMDSGSEMTAADD
jgi:GcvH upstream region-like protein